MVKVTSKEEERNELQLGHRKKTNPNEAWLMDQMTTLAGNLSTFSNTDSFSTLAAGAARYADVEMNWTDQIDVNAATPVKDDSVKRKASTDMLLGAAAGPGSEKKTAQCQGHSRGLSTRRAERFQADW